MSAGRAGPGQKIAGLSRPVPCPSLIIVTSLKNSNPDSVGVKNLIRKWTIFVY